ncbi:sporulation transcription factor Spo0A [Anaerofilum sp. BX8]|uniref:Stage 0 sporulation protein A homolog n=1 Tax=Anaerofilum hominis TaxID=2763016 RepID=A0A923L1K5_9FIRM|nr:sporulation initiation factor Spo0A C-terminal domain-containing protein [Anaerofilum hominis]MBC5581588.1 sporulation transcription factor Spo0A [Anaerofilum hominis]
MQRAKCLMTDLTPSVTERCREALEAREIEVKICEKNGSVLLEAIRRERPQLVLMEAFMPGLDALSIKQRCDGEGLGDIVFFVTGSFADDRLESEMAKRGIAFYFLKPFDPEILAARAASVLQRAETRGPVPDDECTVSEILREVGVPAHLKGYRFARQAILLIAEDESYLNGVTKRLYPDVARSNDTTASRVERAIRHAITVAWERGGSEALHDYFGYTAYSQNGKPTNSEFVAAIADKIRLDKRNRRQA